jgi:zinc transport system ATP-binding protein
MVTENALHPPIVPPLIEARGLCKFFGSHEILHEVNCTVKAGEMVTIVGPNGAGKTTLLKCLLGLETADYGTVTRAEGLRIGYVPQQFKPHSAVPLSVESFLRLYGAVNYRLAKELHVESFMGQSLHRLSGGELRRVLLLRALLHAPQLLVLDEPTSGVDVAGQGELYRLLKRLSEQFGFAVLMVSHDLHVVMASTDRVICLNHHICCEGTPQKVGNDASFRALFGDDLANQLALYHHHHNHTHGLNDDAFAHVHPHPHAGHHHG